VGSERSPYSKGNGGEKFTLCLKRKGNLNIRKGGAGKRKLPATGEESVTSEMKRGSG